MKLGYARTSTTKQENSAETQRKALEDAGAERVYVDEGASGRNASRPEWDRLREALRAGDTLIITKLDRMGRSVKNLADIAVWLRDNDINLLVITQGIDTSTTMGRFTFNILASLAEMEMDLIRERVMEGLAEAALKGHRAGPSKKLSPARITSLKLRFTRGDDPRELCEDYGISRASLFRYVSHGGGRKPE